jgi:DNA-binding MarR family transcriptional regulator
MSVMIAATDRRLRFDSLEQECFLNLWRTYDRLRSLEDELFGEFGITAQQYNLLRILEAEHPQTVLTLDLARRLISRAPDITRMLDGLAERGLVSRERPSDNRRTVRVGITTKGRALLRSIAKPLRDCHAHQLGHVPPNRLRQLSRLLRLARQPHESEHSAWR